MCRWCEGALGRDKWGGETVVDEDGVVGVQRLGGRIVVVVICSSSRIEQDVCGLVVSGVMDSKGGQEVGGGIFHGSGFQVLFVLSGGLGTIR